MVEARPRAPVTIRDVARLARVDPAIVSRVLNEDRTLSIRTETRARVLAAVGQLNYRPNALARGLKLRSSYALGMLLPDVANPLFPDIIKGVEEVAEAAGFHILLSHITPEALVGGRHLELLREGRVAGLLIATGVLPDAVVDDLHRSGFPYVLLNRRARGIDRYVVVDDQGGARLAVEHLLELGHRLIGHLAAPRGTDTGERRLAGYREAYRARALAPDPALVEEAGLDVEDGYRAAGRLLARAPRLSALFATNVPVAMGALAAVREAGLAVPAEVSVMGFHDSPYAARTAPPLTTVRMPLREMGREAARRLVQLVQGAPDGAPVILPADGLVVRESTAPPGPRLAVRRGRGVRAAPTLHDKGGRAS